MMMGRRKGMSRGVMGGDGEDHHDHDDAEE